MFTPNLIMLSGQTALLSAMDVIANNVANANTTGFKRQSVSFDTYVSRAGNATNPKAELDFATTRGTFRDVSNGAIVSTGNPLDVAIQGAGYLQVRLPDGTTGYTRGGALQRNNEGQIVTLSGLPVLGDGGQGITVPETASQLNISGDGTVTARVSNGADLSQLGKITLVKFDNEQSLQAKGGGVYTSSQSPQPNTESTLVQGGIEQSNVQPVTEISSMIQIMRNYEQIANLISKINDTRGNALERLAKTTA